MNHPIGRVVATEKSPTTMDKFTFWTNADLKLHAFDIVKVKHRRVYDADLRERLADRYTGRTAHDCDLANEWWEKFSRLPPEKAEKAKEIIALNKFKDGDFVCNDQDVLDILSYYRITRDDAER